MSEVIAGIEMNETAARARSEVAPFARASARTRVDWLIDNGEAYGPLLESIKGARQSVHIAQLAFDHDCAAYAAPTAARALSPDAVIADTLIELANESAAEIRILLNASWILNTARPLRKYFARRGVPTQKIEVRGMSRFPHFMHAKIVIVDGRDAFLLGSPFVNSYWDDGSHAPFDARRPLRELGGRPLHNVSVRLRGAAVRELEQTFASLWHACGPVSARLPRRSGAAATGPAPKTEASGTRIVSDAPDGMFSGVPAGATQMLDELLAGIARARDFIYIEHQYLSSRPIVAALVAALRAVPDLEIIIVLNQNPDLTGYRGWQNAHLISRGLLLHPRVGVFSLWSTDLHPERAAVTRISQLFIHSKVMIVDDRWAAVGTSNLDGVSMGDYGDDFAGALARRVFRGVRNVEVNVTIDAHAAQSESSRTRSPALRAEEARAIVALRERLWQEHLATASASLRKRPARGWLSLWREAAARNVRALAGEETNAQMTGRVLPYSTEAFPTDQLRDLGVQLTADSTELCYSPTWLSVHAGVHWVRNIF